MPILYNVVRVRACVCMCERANSKCCGRIWVKFSGSTGYGTGTTAVDFEHVPPHGGANFGLTRMCAYTI